MNAASPARLSLSTKLAYSVGNVGIQMLVAAMSFFLMVFLTDVALVAPAVAGSALMLGKLWDAVNDPLMGWLSDRTRSRHGRRRVYLIYGALPLGLLAAMLWMMPAGLPPIWAFVWIVVVYTVFDTALTLVQMPYAALSADMTTDYDERTSLMAIASIGALIGYILGSVAMPMMVKSAATPQYGYMLAGGVLGLIVGASVAFVAWRVHEPATEARSEAVDATPWASLASTLKNRPFLTLASAFGLIRLGLTIVQMMLVYFVVYQLHEHKEMLPKLMLVLLLMVGISIVFWKWATERWEKNITYAAGMMVSAAGIGWTFWIQPGQLGPMFACVAVIGIGMGAHWVVPYAMLPDAIDEGQAATGERRSGMYLGVFGLFDKLARTVGAALVGWVLQAFNYVPNVPQTEEALLGIRIAFGVLPPAFIILAIPLLLAYPITRARHAVVRERLGRRRQGHAATPSGFGTVSAFGRST